MAPTTCGKTLHAWFAQNLVACCLAWLCAVAGIYIGYFVCASILSLALGYSVLFTLSIILVLTVFGFVLGACMQRTCPRCMPGLHFSSIAVENDPVIAV